MTSHSLIRQVSRVGAYAVAVEGEKILLVMKQPHGCYAGLLDLPGGGIEFGETPEEALRREFREEVCMEFHHLQPLANCANTADFVEDKGPFRFHHVGLLYRVFDWSPIDNAVAEEEFGWYSLDSLLPSTLTPFAKAAIRLLSCSQV